MSSQLWSKSTQNSSQRETVLIIFLFNAAVAASLDASSLAPGSLDFDTVLTFPFMAPVGIVTSENVYM